MIQQKRFSGWMWIVGFMLLAIAMAFAPDRAHAATRSGDDFKGPLDTNEWTGGAMAGLGLLNSTAGVAVMGQIAKKIVDQGFVPDVNNQVFFEASAGPLFLNAGTALAYSLHLRWDFRKDDDLTLYGLGGLGGDVTGASLGSQWILHPRMAAGIFYTLQPGLALRGEVSHEFTGVGVSFGF